MANLTHLKTGLVIDAQPGFVETFNYLVDFVKNLKGDKDRRADASVSVDVSDPAHPVIRYESETGESGSISVADGLRVVTGVEWNASDKTIDVTTGNLAIVDGELRIDPASLETTPIGTIALSQCW